MNKSPVEEYREYAEICNKTDYGNSHSVKAHNNTAIKMWKLVEKAAKGGTQGIAPLF